MNCRRLTGCLGLFLLISGCGGGGPAKATLYPVSGKVTSKGQPLAGYTIQFANAGIGFGGKTGPDGAYTLSDIGDQRAGAAAGKYKVVLMPSADAAYAAMKAGGYGPGGTATTDAIPKEYNTADTSPKEVEVKAESNIINIDIP